MTEAQKRQIHRLHTQKPRRLLLTSAWGRLLREAAGRKDGKVLHDLRGSARLQTWNKLISLGLIRDRCDGDCRTEMGEITDLGRLCVARGYVEV